MPCLWKKLRWVEQAYPRCVRDLDVAGKQCYLHFVQFKIRCSCGYRGVERLEFADKYSHYSNAFEEFVARLCDIMSLTDASKITFIPWRAVKQIDKKYLAKYKIGLEFSAPTRIGVDEVAHQKGHKYLTVVRDIDEHRVIWVGEGRKKEVLNSFFKELGDSKTRGIRVIVMDMWDPYIASVQQHCPAAEIVFDKFHVIKKPTKQWIKSENKNSQWLTKQNDLK